jgi:hypothetical protein
VKQLRLNLLLLAIVLVLAAVAYFGQKKEAPKGQPLTALKAEAIDKIVLQHPKAADIVLEKKAGQWMLTAPVQVAADPFELNSLLGVATTETKTIIEPKDIQLADLGLDPPGFSLTLNDVKIDFGGTQPYNFQRYVESGGKIALIDDPPASALDADYSDLVAKSLLPQGAEIASIAVPGLKVSRGADGKSWSADPADPKAGSDELQKFVDAWAAARALWNTAMPAPVAPAPPTVEQVPGAKPSGKPPFNPPAGPPPSTPQAAVVTLKDGSVLNFTIGTREPQLVLERPDFKLQYDLAKSDADKLLKLPEPLPPAATEQKMPAAAPDKKAEAAPAPPVAAK